MSDDNEFNRRVIEQFRANSGKVGDFFADKDLLLLHTIGAKTGEPRLHPLVCMTHIEAGIEQLYIIASAGGSLTHPAWYLNLAANPDVEVEFGTSHFSAKARVVDEPLRSELYSRAAARYSFFAEYEKTTAGVRVIPVILLERTT